MQFNLRKQWDCRHLRVCTLAPARTSQAVHVCWPATHMAHFSPPTPTVSWTAKPQRLGATALEVTNTVHNTLLLVKVKVPPSSHV